MSNRDLREYSRQTTTRLIIGGLILLFVVGTGLIYWRYGAGGALSGLLCLTIALFPIGLILVIMAFLEWLVKRIDHD